MDFVVEALDGRVLLDGAVHPLDLTIGPGVPGPGHSMIDIVASARYFKGGAQNGLLRASIPLISATDQLCPFGVGEMSPIVGSTRYGSCGGLR